MLDPQGVFPRTIGSIAMPTTLFFDKAGKLVDTRVGEFDVIPKNWGSSKLE